MSITLSPSLSLSFLTLHSTLSPKPTNLSFPPSTPLSLLHLPPRHTTFRIYSDDVDFDYSDYDEEPEDLDNTPDYEFTYATPGTLNEDGTDPSLTSLAEPSPDQGWDDVENLVEKIDEDLFHKLKLIDCDFFIKKAPNHDPEEAFIDNADVGIFDFSEMYVTPPDTDVYYIPKVLAPMPQEYIRCSISEFGSNQMNALPIERAKDPAYRIDKHVYKVFLQKHYENRRASDPDFMLDFEEIYVIDSKTKSITRAKILVTIPEGPKRDRKRDFLIVGDKGNSFKIIDIGKKPHPTDVIDRDEWAASRQDMENYLRKMRDFNVSNWF